MDYQPNAMKVLLEMKQREQRLFQKISKIQKVIKDLVKDRDVILVVGSSGAGKTAVVQALLTKPQVSRPGLQNTKQSLNEIPFTLHEAIDSKSYICDFKGFGDSMNFQEEVLICSSIMSAMKQSANFKLALVVPESLFTEPKFISLRKLLTDLSQVISNDGQFNIEFWLTMAAQLQTTEQIVQTLETIQKETKQKKERVMCDLLKKANIEIFEYLKKKQGGLVVRQNLRKRLFNFEGCRKPSIAASKICCFLNNKNKSDICKELQQIQSTKQQIFKRINGLKSDRTNLIEFKFKLFSNKACPAQVQKILEKNGYQYTPRIMDDLKGINPSICQNLSNFSKILYWILQHLRLQPTKQEIKQLIQEINQSVERQLQDMIAQKQNELSMIGEVGENYQNLLN